MNGFLLLAAVASLITFGLHVFAAGPKVAAPLLRAKDIKPVAKYTNYYCWHIVSIVLLAMGGAYFWAAKYPDGLELAVLATAMAFSFMIWGLALIVWKRQPTRFMPQWVLFAVITGLGTAGLVF